MTRCPRDVASTAPALRAGLRLSRPASAAQAGRPRRACRCRVFADKGGSGGLGDGSLILIEDLAAYRRKEAEHAHEQQIEAVALLAGTLSHEINQPLNAILGRAQLALLGLSRDTPEKADLKRDMEEIVQCVRRISDILERLHSVTEIVTKPYLGETRILDLERSAGTLSSSWVVKGRIPGDSAVAKGDAPGGSAG